MLKRDSLVLFLFVVGIKLISNGKKVSESMGGVEFQRASGGCTTLLDILHVNEERGLIRKRGRFHSQMVGRDMRFSQFQVSRGPRIILAFYEEVDGGIVLVNQRTTNFFLFFNIWIDRLG